MRTGLIAGFAALIVVVIFIIQNPHAVNISFLGVHLVLPLAVALLLAAVAGALVMVAAGTARITQLRRMMRRDRRKAPAGVTSRDDRPLRCPGDTPQGRSTSTSATVICPAPPATAHPAHVTD